jgi:acetyltransferase-like isoleucine patch superfamily enzyme
VRIGDRLGLRSSLVSNPLAPSHPVVLCTWRPQAELIIGNDFAMTGGVICAAHSIHIGDRVAVGANCTIIDTDFHPLNPAERRRHPNDAAVAPVVIEDDVFIGMHSLVLKGVRLGRGCVIGAGSVVTRDVPAGMIAAGNPAKLIGQVQST